MALVLTHLPLRGCGLVFSSIPTGLFSNWHHSTSAYFLRDITEKSHLFPSPSESPWRIFLSPLVSLGWFALWQISGTLHFPVLVFPVPAWKTHKQRAGYSTVLPPLDQRAASSCWVTSWRSAFYMMLWYQAKALPHRASCVSSFATKQTLIKGNQPRGAATRSLPPLCSLLWGLPFSSRVHS